jgi:MFS family permease
MNDSDKKRSGRELWYPVLACAFVGCAIAAGFPQFSVTLSPLSAATGISQAVLLTGETVKSVGIVLSMLLSGFLYNRLGARPIFLFSTVAAILPLLTVPHVSSVPLLMAVKLLQGGASVVFPVFLVIILDRAEAGEAGLATAVFNGIFYGGGGIGGTFAAIIVERHGWIASYYALAAVQAALCLLWLATVREKAPRAAARAAEAQAAPGGPAKRARQGKALNTVLLSVSFLATTWTVQAVTVDMPVFGEALGYGNPQVGTIMTAVAVGIVAACVASGWASDFLAARLRRRGAARIFVFAAGHLLTVASVCLIAFGDMRELRLFFLAAFLLSFAASWGLGSFYPILPEIFEAETVPVATGICGGVGDAGMPAAPFVVGVCFGLRGFWAEGWGSCAVVAAVSLLAALLLAGIESGARSAAR